MMQWGMRWAAVMVAAASVAVAAPAAHAGPWTPVDNGLVDTSRPSVSLRKSTTTIVWTTPDGELMTRSVSGKGRLGSSRALQRGWNYLSVDPVRAGSEYVAAGTRSVPGSNLYWPGAAFATDGGGLESLTDDYAYLSQGQDALVVGGRLVYAYTDGAAAVQIASLGLPSAQIARGTAQEPALAAGGSATYLGWHAQGDGLLISEVSVQAGGISIAPPVAAPESLYTTPAQRVALIVRKGQPWAAYQSAARQISIWRPGLTTPTRIVTEDPVVAVDLARAGSRMWLAYATSKRVCVQRSASAGSAFGAPTCRTAAASGVALAAGKYADVVATVAPKALYARMLPSISVTTRPRSGVVVVRDAGEPVAKAQVVVGTQKTRTNSAGRARLDPWPRKRTVDVRAPGFEVWRGR